MKKIPPKFKLLVTVISFVVFGLVSKFQERNDSSLRPVYDEIQEQSSSTQPSSSDFPKDLIKVKVVKVSDGDTLTVELLNHPNKENDSKFFSQRERVRLIGVDAPEKSQAVWGERAKSYLKEKVKP